MLRPVTRRFYAVLALLLAVNLAAGFFWASNGLVEKHIYQYGLTAMLVVPALIVTAYTLARQKWWRNDLGMSLVCCCLAYYPIIFPLAYVFWFDNGMLTQSWLAWLEVSGPVSSCLVLLWTASIVARMRLDRMRSDQARAVTGQGEER